jgi:excisionase family DNA binding protein
MAEPKLLTVPQVAAEFQVTAQTIRNWIDHGTLPAVRVGRAFRVKRQDVDALLERASADSTSLATRRDLWQPTTTTLPHRPARSGTTPPTRRRPTSRHRRRTALCRTSRTRQKAARAILTLNRDRQRPRRLS